MATTLRPSNTASNSVTMVSCFRGKFIKLEKNVFTEFCIYNLSETHFFFKLVCVKKKFDINSFDINYMYMQYFSDVQHTFHFLKKKCQGT